MDMEIMIQKIINGIKEDLKHEFESMKAEIRDVGERVTKLEVAQPLASSCKFL